MSLIYKGQTVANVGGSGGGSSSSSEEIYSTEETRIGTWIDGKPLYRKTVLVTIPYTSDGSDYTFPLESFSMTSIDTLVAIYGQWCNSANETYHAMDYNSQIECIYSPYLSRSNTGVFSLHVFSNRRNDNRSGSVTLEYTKTTDEATS